MKETENTNVFINDKKIECLICKNDTFTHRKTLLNTRGMTFFGFDWLNDQVNSYTCTKCKFIHQFDNRKYK